MAMAATAGAPSRHRDRAGGVGPSSAPAATRAGDDVPSASSAPTSAQREVRRQVLLDRLRSKSAHFRSFAELAKSTRAAVLDRRFTLDADEKSLLQKSLDSMQEKIPVKSAQGMAERLETICRKIGLKFMAAPVHGCFYLSTNMFYVQIDIEGAAGGVKVSEAKIHHNDATQGNHQNTVNCPDIIECLTDGDFATFVRHLEGLVAVYNIGPQASASEQSRAWNALSFAERDLELIYNSYRNHSSVPASAGAASLLHSTPLGLVEPRKGGLPMRLRYFLPPHHLMEAGTNRLMEASLENVRKHDLGLTVTVTLDKSSAPCSLPLRNLASSVKGGEVVFEEVNHTNSVNLPAYFVLELSEPMAVSIGSCRAIQQISGTGGGQNPIFNFDEAASTPIFELIAKNKSGGQLETANNRGLFVTLPDQMHCYFLTDLPGCRAVMIKSIPFTHPAHVKDILSVLRKQAAFNTLIESCVRVNSIQDVEKSIMFEVTYMSLQRLQVTFDYPGEDTMMTVEIDLSDIQGVRCTSFVSAGRDGPHLRKDSLLTAIMRKSFSIPVTMRTLVKAGLEKLARLAREEQLRQLQLQQQIRQSQANGSQPGQGRPVGTGNGSGVADANGNQDNGGVDDKGGGAEIKSEPMDYEPMDHSGSNTQGSDHLNALRPQDAASNPEASSSSNNAAASSLGNSRSGNLDERLNASSKRSSSSKDVMSKASSSSPSRHHKSNVISSGELSIKAEPSVPPLVKMEPVKPEFILTKSSHPSKESLSKKDGQLAPPTIVTDITPNFSITPIGSGDGNPPPTSSSSSKKPTSGGIEIIPLGSGMSSKGGSSNRDIRRSLSEDDKRKLDKKAGSSSSSSSSSKKRKHDSPSREGGSSSSSAKKRAGSGGGHSSSSSSSKRSSLSSTSSSKKMASVLERLSPNSNLTGIEITPASSATIIPSSSNRPKDKSSSQISKSGTSSSSSSSLKIMVKSPISSSSSKQKTSSPSSGSKDRSGTSSSSSSSSKYSSSKSSSSSSSSSHRHSSSTSSSPSSKDKSKSSSSSGSSDKDRKRSSSDRDRDRDRHHGGSGGSSSSRHHHSSSSHHHHSSSSSSHHGSSGRDRERDDEAVKKVLDGGKLTKTFQIPKLSSSSSNPGGKGQSPSYTPSGGSSTPSGSSSRTPTTSPKYSISPKYQQQQQGQAMPSSSPKYIGGGSVTPPNISPKHPYSAPSSVAGLTKSSPLHPASSRTPGASPTHGKTSSAGDGGAKDVEEKSHAESAP